MQARQHTPAPNLPRERRERIGKIVLVAVLAISAAVLAATPFNSFLMAGNPNLSIPLGKTFFPVGAFGVLLIMTLGVNVVLRKFAPHWTLSPAQLAAMWIVVVASSSVGNAPVGWNIPSMVHGPYFASPENNWGELLADPRTQSLLVSDPAAIEGFYEGLPLGSAVPFQPWLRPVAIWAIYIAGMQVMMIGLAGMLRRRWVEQERFTFPVVQVPVQIAASPSPGQLINGFLRNRLVWAAVIILSIVHILGGLHALYPAIPEIPLRWSDYRFTEPPLSYTGVWRARLWPTMVGFAYLIPSEVSFSLWFFFLLHKLRLMVLGMFGLRYGANWVGAQLEEAGATVTLVSLFVWLGRGHFGNVFRKALTGDRSIDDADEPLTYRAMVVLFLIGTALMIGWLAHFGGSLVMGLLVVVMFVATLVALSWMVNQAGFIFVLPPYYITQVIATLTGSSIWSRQSLLITRWSDYAFHFEMSECLLPSLLNGYKISDATGLHRGSLLKACVGAIALGFPISVVATLWMHYTRGGALGFASYYPMTRHMNLIHSWVSATTMNPLKIDPILISHFVGGSLLMVGLVWLRTHLTWFNLHPIGFLIADDWLICALSLSIFSAWLIKSAVVRWGGHKTYEVLRPFFLGLIIGDTLNGVIWIIVGFFTSVPYRIGC